MHQFYHGSLAIRLNGNEYVLKDNSNGEIYNIDNVLQHKGKINYITGEIDFELHSADTVYMDIYIDYIKNQANITTYRNLNTEEFTFDVSSMKINEVQNLI